MTKMFNYKSHQNKGINRQIVNRHFGAQNRQKDDESSNLAAMIASNNFLKRFILEIIAINRIDCLTFFHSFLEIQTHVFMPAKDSFLSFTFFIRFSQKPFKCAT